jgi:hypothetical protein
MATIGACASATRAGIVEVPIEVVKCYRVSIQQIWDPAIDGIVYQNASVGREDASAIWLYRFRLQPKIADGMRCEGTERRLVPLEFPDDGCIREV